MGVKLILKEGLKGIVPREKLELLPGGYQRVGDVILVRLDPGLKKWEKEIGCFLKERFQVQSVFSRGTVSGESRTPQVKRIAGRRNTTVHLENGILYKIDLSKLMFSQGNLLERGRVVAGEEEEVVDFFAGIGYYSLGIAKRTPSCRVIAVEKNPAAVKFLKENVRLNRLTNVEIVEGDCREFEGKADRVVMGYFPGTEAFLPAAFKILRSSGIIHFHNLYRRGELWRKPLGELETTAREQGYRIEVLHKRVVKPTSPCKVHVVLDVKARKV